MTIEIRLQRVQQTTHRILDDAIPPPRPVAIGSLLLSNGQTSLACRCDVTNGQDTRRLSVCREGALCVPTGNSIAPPRR